jgi:hypothetical protein
LRGTLPGGAARVDEESGRNADRETPLFRRFAAFAEKIFRRKKLWIPAFGVSEKGIRTDRQVATEMESGGELIGEDESAFLPWSPRIIPAKFDGVAGINRLGGAYDLNADGLPIPFRGCGGAMKRFSSGNNEANASQRLIPGIHKLIGATHGEARFRRSDEVQFHILFLDCISRTKRNTARAKKTDAEEKDREQDKTFGEKALQDKTIVARGIGEAKRRNGLRRNR